MKVALLFVTVFAFSGALPVDPNVANDASSIDVATRNSDIEAILLGVIEDLRLIMINGSEEDNVPVLDPFELDQARLELDEFGLPGAHIAVQNFEARKLSTFEIDHLSVTLTSFLLQRYTVEIEARIPELEIEMENYDLLVSVDGFTIFGDGVAKMKMIDPRIKATFVVGPRLSISGIFINMFSCNIGIQMTAFQPELTGMFGSDITNDFTNLFLAELVPQMLEFFEEDITELLSGVVLEIANNILADLDLGGILNPSHLAEIFDIPALQQAAALEANL